jgi:AAA15 family ATPase/GTPase
MFIRFTVQNFRSFYTEQTLNLVASSDSHHKGHAYKLPQSNISVLRASALYGANGSGKSNLIKAIRFSRRLILKGTPPDEDIAISPYKLHPKSENEPSKFEYVIFCAEKIYTYGFVIDKKRVHEEWLFVDEKKCLFERTTNAENKNQIEFNKAIFKGEGLNIHRFIAEGARANQLVLCEFRSKNENVLHPSIVSVLHWFAKSLDIITPDSVFNELATMVQNDGPFAAFASTFLQDVGTGVKKVSTEVSTASMDNKNPNKILNQFTSGRNVDITDSDGSNMKNNSGKVVLKKIKSSHTRSDGEDIVFDMKDESAGTQRLLHLLPALYTLKQGASVFIIDEIESSMHALLSKKIVEFFLEHCGNTPSQLIFTTHETNLLDLDLLRRDEIWFTEKKDGESHIYSLADFKVRDDLRIEKGYLHGRFGGIPIMGNLDRLTDQLKGDCVDGTHPTPDKPA